MYVSGAAIVVRVVGIEHDTQLAAAGRGDGDA